MPMVKVSNGGSSVVSGFITATSSAVMTVNVGFRPSLVVCGSNNATPPTLSPYTCSFYCEQLNSTQYFFSRYEGGASNYKMVNLGTDSGRSIIDITDNGFTYDPVVNGNVMYYIAVK